MLNAAGMRIRRSVAAVMVGVAASVIVTALIAAGAWPTTNTWFAADTLVGAAPLPAAPPVSVAVVSAVFHVMFTVAGMRMRRSVAAVIVARPASVTVIGLIAAGAWPTTKLWFAAEAIVGATIWIVRLSLAAVPPPAPETTSCR